MNIQDFKKQVLPQLTEQLLSVSADDPVLTEAMHYALGNGGKRVRPLLLLATLATLGASLDRGFAAACALEYVHTYSLIHDDLPAMDNDDLRRGRPTCHRQFDEATAILAGDALLTAAFERITQSACSSEQQVLLIRHLSQAVGPQGMVGGQMRDMRATQRQLTLDELQHVHRLKTGALLWYAVFAGAVLADAPAVVQQHLTAFATHFGLAFQIHNDLQDVSLSTADSGKESGKDIALGKNTYPALLGRSGAIAALKAEVHAAQDVLAQLHTHEPTIDCQLLRGFLHYVHPTAEMELL